MFIEINAENWGSCSHAGCGAEILKDANSDGLIYTCICRYRNMDGASTTTATPPPLPNSQEAIDKKTDDLVDLINRKGSDVPGLIDEQLDKDTQDLVNRRIIKLLEDIRGELKDLNVKQAEEATRGGFQKLLRG